ncbi:Domain of unknown function DUF3844 [Ceraceosorus bombacis]|uniref:Vacuolar sorting protein Vps3844 C-terminal domain-containing protein n=1 Tax=Ceraceosorus bombacis TaxID=401625 RepID=A0A0P1BJG6_9BASI|nr:Domain of unknown function DUF3844 [Ceraceosorus bombacis]
MRWTVFGVAAVLLATIASAQSAPRTASLHLFPSSISDDYSIPEVSASQVHKLLSYHLSIPGEKLDGAHWAHPEAWRWIDEKSRPSAKDLFGASEQDLRKAIIVLRADDADLIPKHLAQTHKISQPHDKENWDALFNVYAERLGGLTGSLIHAASRAAEELSDWATGSNEEDRAERTFQDVLRESATSLDNGDASFELLRFDTALEGISQQSGDASDDLDAARSQIKEQIETLFSSARSTDSRHSIALLLIPASEQEEGLAKRQVQDPLAPFGITKRADRWTDGQGSWSEASSSGSEALWSLSDSLKNSSKPPKESDYVGKCFSSESDLNKATADCSGRGKAVLSTKGARRCYVCQCSKTKEKGSSTSWAGEACQKVDLSTSFTLLATTTVGLLATIFMSISFLVKEGNRELPSVLTGLSGAKH